MKCVESRQNEKPDEDPVAARTKRGLGATADSRFIPESLSSEAASWVDTRISPVNFANIFPLRTYPSCTGLARAG